MARLKCTECGAATKEAREPHLFDRDVGVTLREVTLLRCTECGAEILTLSKPRRLQEAIVDALASGSGRLRSADVRFIREHLGMTGVEFARLLGVSPVSVSRWENGPVRRMGESTERLIRLVGSSGRVDLRRLTISKRERTGRLVFAYKEGKWSPVDEGQHSRASLPRAARRQPRAAQRDGGAAHE